MKIFYKILIIGIIVFVSGIVSDLLTTSRGVDFGVLLVTIGLLASGLILIGGSFMIHLFNRRVN